MTTPKIVDTKPVLVELEAGKKYWFCRCGSSETQPYCDGSHQGTDFQPMQLKLEKREKLWLCGCKHSGEPPFCDGTHKQFIPELNE